ncbi:Nascent polypeptide-associated complex protein [Halostagnicola sp. A56]|uniref:nascent polypeptide-associated complex protein n=1 Tax=Halostagnicola sp. A56 TaxID=1495067 RepID=UPI00049EBA15|nr:nascent polypeptide-associated complex protein [Halostagnicola sp. A56]KDE57503.1 Nascent polypeptide-associated complex protein [Halostagnicola sp. A56]
MFGGGGGGLNPRKMEQMMKQMGIDVDDIDAEEVIIRTAEHDLVFTDPEVTKMDARGQETYQVIGTPDERAAGSAGELEAGDGDNDSGSSVDEDDVDLVVTRTGASEEKARRALEDNDGDLAATVAELE